MRTRVLLCLLLGLLGIAAIQTGCGEGLFSRFMASAGASAQSGGKSHQGGAGAGGILSGREDLAHTLTQLQWVFIGLGIAGVVASFWIPLISTRHAVGSVGVGIGIAIARPFIIALYWPTIICIGLAGIAAGWPYGVAVVTWARSRFMGKPAPVPTIGVVASLKSLVMARSQVAAPGFPDVPDGPVDSGSGASSA